MREIEKIRRKLHSVIHIFYSDICISGVGLVDRKHLDLAEVNRFVCQEVVRAFERAIKPLGHKDKRLSNIWDLLKCPHHSDYCFDFVLPTSKMCSRNRYFYSMLYKDSFGKFECKQMDKQASKTEEEEDEDEDKDSELYHTRFTKIERLKVMEQLVISRYAGGQAHRPQGAAKHLQEA